MTRPRPTFHRGADCASLRPRSAGRGFTLLELLVATAVSAIVLLVISATFFSALRLHETTHASIDRDLALQRTLGIVRKDLAGIMLPGGVLSGQLQTTSFFDTDLDGSGGERVSPDLFTNSGRIDGWTSYADVQMVSYYLTPAADGGNTKDFVRVVTRNLLSPQTPTSDDQTLLSRVSSATVEFYDGTDWTDTWDSSTSGTLPSALKFSLVLAPIDNDAARANPGPIELIVPVLATTATSQRQALASQ